MGIELEAPCDGTMESVLVWWNFASTGALEQQPSITIDVPSTVSCPDDVALAKTIADPDGDIETVRWWVDDVLIDSANTSISFTTGHELTAVVWDERGAAKTARKVVSCQ